MFLPCEGVAAARAEIGNKERRIIRILCSHNFFQLLRFGLQTALAFFDDGRRFQAAEIEFVDDGKNENLEEHRLYHRAFDADVQTALIVGVDLDEAALELEKFEIIDKVAFDKAQTAQIVEFVMGKAQLAQGVEFAFQVFLNIGQRIYHLFVAATEFVEAVGLRELVQHDLQHGEFVQVGIKQGLDNGLISRHKLSLSKRGR